LLSKFAYPEPLTVKETKYKEQSKVGLITDNNSIDSIYDSQTAAGKSVHTGVEQQNQASVGGKPSLSRNLGSISSQVDMRSNLNTYLTGSPEQKRNYTKMNRRFVPFPILSRRIPVMHSPDNQSRSPKF